MKKKVILHSGDFLGLSKWGRKTEKREERKLERRRNLKVHQMQDELS